MTAHELRLGNWVMHPKEGLRKTHFDVLNNAEIHSGVPLTREWLLKFGFHDDSYANFFYTLDEESHLVYSFQDYGHTKISDWPITIAVTTDWKLDYTPPYKIQYVHQLQNLYFALTGEELTFHNEIQP